MLFDLRHFEQSFNDRTLKKGLRIFEAGEVEVIGSRQAGVTSLLISAACSLTLKTKGEKLLEYTCSCEKTDLCEHLAAALFYFQKDALGFFVKKRAAKKRVFPKAESGWLKTELEHYKEKLNELLSPYKSSKALNQAQLDELYSAITTLKEEAQQQGRGYDLDLAVALILPSVFGLRLLGNESSLREFLKETLQTLDRNFGPRLSETEKATWRAATLESVKNNIALRSDLFLFLVPRFLAITTNLQHLEKLKTAIRSRKYKMSYESRFDKLLIAKLEVAIKESQVFKRSLPEEFKEAVVELLIARSELDLCNHKTTAAFNRLALQEETVRKKHAFYYSAYLDYCIEKSREKERPAMELQFLKKSFIYNPYISTANAERFLSLIPLEELDAQLHEIISGIKRNRAEHAFDKLADLLFITGRLDELMAELKRQKRIFHLLHKVLMKKLPHYDAATLGFYMDQLREALADAESYQVQLHVFAKAKNYLDQLPEEVREDLVSNLLEREGKLRQIYRYIAEHMEH